MSIETLHRDVLDFMSTPTTDQKVSDPHTLRMLYILEGFLMDLQEQLEDDGATIEQGLYKTTYDLICERQLALH